MSDMTPVVSKIDHPTQFRWSIRAAALVAIGTWWGVGLPYSLFAWMLDAKQANWVFICYAWEVPVCGFFGPFLFPERWFRAITRRWERVFANPAHVDPDEAAGLERALLDFPTRTALVLLVTSVLGYAIGALQLRIFSQLPSVELVKVILLGVVTGLIGALFAFLYLEWLLAPLLKRLGRSRAIAPPAGRRIPLYTKIFACSLILTVCAPLLLGPMFYSRGERILEEQIGERISTEVRHLAAELTQPGAIPGDLRWWREREARMHLGPLGYAFVVDADGTVSRGDTRSHHLSDEGFRPASVRTILNGDHGHLVDRVHEPRIAAFARLDDAGQRVVAVVFRHEFASELNSMLLRGSVVFLATLLLALFQGFLLARRLTRPIEIVTDWAGTIARDPGKSLSTVPLRTNDEVGELAIAFNHMTSRLEEARGALERYSAELERRVAEATRNISTLYDVTRATTSTLEIENVLKLVAEKTLSTLALPRLVVLWYPPEVGDAVDAYVIAAGASGKQLSLQAPVDLASLCHSSKKPNVVPLATLATALPATVADAIATTDVMCLPLVFKNDLLGLILAGLAADGGAPDLELAAALASQAGAALANAKLFETARRHEVELRKLSQMRVQLQEENMRQLSRELHDGVGQMLTAIKMDLGMIERNTELDTTGLQARVREVREQVMELVNEVRSMSQLLRPSMLDDFGLVPTLQWLVEKFTVRTRIPVDLRTPPAETRLPGAIEVLLYRVTQEALTNIIKHANARHVDIELAIPGSEVVLTIADDGVGFDVERFRRTPSLGGVGLLGMRERVAYYHGRVDIRSRLQAGVRITLTIPLEAPAGGVAEHGRFPLAG